MKQEINLEEILNKYSIYLNPYVKEHLQLKAAISDLICKTLDLVATNVELDYGKGGCPLCGSNSINKDSILQIKNWIK
jgi:Zn finger protein HypA/HybF involved in hydrogenase expression